ncbi:MAG: hypothetical protein GXO77_02485 [Calditrichaeota bacterium]|nr:hypothetical protein [Calditrichota bacterium]
MPFIPSLQSIYPHYWVRFPRKVFKTVFPFNHPRLMYFYFARNGIYHLGEYLKNKGMGRMLFPAYNHGNEIRALLAAGVELEYYKILSDTNIDFDDLEKKIRQTGIKVLYFIHYVGMPQNPEKIAELKKKYNLILIEDNALGLFSGFRDQPLGSFGDVSIFCFYKTLPIPNGGGLCINNPELNFTVAVKAPQLVSTLSRTAGLVFTWMDLKFDGFGRKLQKIKSSFGNIADKMEVERVPVLDSQFDVSRADWGMSRISYYLIDRVSVEEICERRRKNYQFMHEHIPEKFHLFSELPEQAVPWFFPVKVKNREVVFRELTSRGVDCARFWRHSHPDIPAERFPEVRELRDLILELPIHQDLDEKQLSFISEQFNQLAK